jgi:predicted DNA repair protein MutK
MKALSVLGTAAMFLVGGAILTHGIPAVHHGIEAIATGLSAGFLQWLVPTLLDGLFGVVAGIVALIIVIPAQRLLKSGK